VHGTPQHLPTLYKLEKTQTLHHTRKYFKTLQNTTLQNTPKHNILKHSTTFHHNPQFIKLHNSSEHFRTLHNSPKQSTTLHNTPILSYLNFTPLLFELAFKNLI